TKSSVVTVSIDATVKAIDRETASVRWSRNLRTDFGARLPQSGFASSPLVYKNHVILPTLGHPQSAETERYAGASDKPDSDRISKQSSIPGAVALELSTGRTIWRSKTFRSSHASPTIVEIDGQETLVFHGLFELVGLDPSTGSVLWRHLLRELAADNVTCTPIWDASSNRMLISHGYCEKGTQAIEIKRTGDRWLTRTAWTNSRLRAVHTNIIRVGSTLLGVNSVGAELAVGINVRDGRTLFRERSTAANFICDDGIVMGLTHSGLIFVANVNEHGLEELWSQKILEPGCWTVPSFAGSRVLIRNGSEVRSLRFI
ncbi:MAG: PQQ-binding-like beta-propeller repeat protein, partial [Planctomycetota bacterium]